VANGKVRWEDLNAPGETADVVAAMRRWVLGESPTPPAPSPEVDPPAPSPEDRDDTPACCDGTDPCPACRDSFATGYPVAEWPGSLTLAELIDHEEQSYRSWGNDAGDLIADHVAELAGLVRFMRAETPAQYTARKELQDEWAGMA
jgi:hypothetical protein